MIGNFSYNHPIGNHTVPEPSTVGTERSVQEFLDLDPWLQCRVVMSTSEGEAWTLPDMDAVAWGMEETVFTDIERTELQSYGQPLNLTTLADVDGAESPCWCSMPALGGCVSSPKNRVGHGP